MEHKGFEVPNHTQTPNSFFDESLRHIKSLCELKVMLVIIRKTFGWQKRRDLISLTQLEAATGLTRQGIQAGIKLAIEHGFIERQPVGQGFSYALVLGNDSYPAKLLPSLNNCLEVGNGSSQLLGNNLTPQKKQEKEKKESKSGAPQSGADQRLKNPFVVAYRDACHITPNHEQRDAIIAQVTNAEIWQAVLGQFMREGRQPNRVDWLLERYGNASAPRQGKPLTTADIQRMKEEPHGSTARR